MWTPLVTLYALVLLALIGAAGCTALVITDERRAARAIVLLKVLLAATLGSTGLFALLVHLHNAGLL